MAKIQLDLDREEDRVVTIVKGIYYLTDKKQSIKKIIREYGKNIKAEDKNIDKNRV